MLCEGVRLISFHKKIPFQLRFSTENDWNVNKSSSKALVYFRMNLTMFFMFEQALILCFFPQSFFLASLDNFNYDFCSIKNVIENIKNKSLELSSWKSFALTTSATESGLQVVIKSAARCERNNKLILLSRSLLCCLTTLMSIKCSGSYVLMEFMRMRKYEDIQSTSADCTKLWVKWEMNEIFITLEESSEAYETLNNIQVLIFVEFVKKLKLKAFLSSLNWALIWLNLN